MEVYGLKPVNKTAGIVTSQNGVSDNFLLAEKQTLKVLGDRKKYFMDAIVGLKEDIGINSAREGQGAKKKYPRRILLHPKFKELQRLRGSITKLDAEIKEVRDRIKKTEPLLSFEERFMQYMRENHSELYAKVRDMVNSSAQQPDKEG